MVADPLHARRSIACTRLAIGMAMAMAFAANSGAQPAPLQPAPNKRCEAANKRVAREVKDVTATLDALGRERKARETCPTRIVCAKHDETIATLEKRHQRHEIRLVRSRNETIEACRRGP